MIAEKLASTKLESGSQRLFNFAQLKLYSTPIQEYKTLILEMRNSVRYFRM